MKMLRSLAVLAAATTVLGLGACQSAHKDTGAAAGVLNSKCPFSGEPVDTSVTTAYQGGKVAFCCAGCKGKWDKASAEAKADMLNKWK